MSVGARILYHLARNGMQQKELAEKVNIDTSVLSRIINDRRPARADEIANIADALHVSIDDLLERQTLLPGLLGLDEIKPRMKPEDQETLELALKIKGSPEIRKLVEDIIKMFSPQKPHTKK